MPELRWTLLVLGVLFIAALAWWELRKPRQIRRGDLERRVPGGHGTPHATPKELNSESPGVRIYREPTLGLPEVRPRDPVPAVPVIEVNDDTMIGLRVDGKRVEEDNKASESDAEPPPILPSEREPEPEPSREPIWEEEREMVWGEGASEPATDESEAVVRGEPGLPSDEPVSEIESDEAAFDERPSLPLPPLDVPPLVEPIVDWPDESQRQILALRLVAPVDRFPGRALRQALSAEGFLLGKLEIFHKPGEDGRAIVSAASLTRPGTFSAETIDIQRFGGLNLFAVLPGPLPAAEAFEELLSAARNLNERLQGGLQDDKGQPLTPTRVAAIRASLGETPAPQSTEPSS